MKTLLAFLRSTGRSIRRHINRLLSVLKENGTLKMGVTVSIPPFIKINVGYDVKLSADKQVE